MSQTSTEIETETEVAQLRLRALKIKIKGNFTLTGQSQPYHHPTPQAEGEHEHEVEAVEGINSGLAFHPGYWWQPPAQAPEEAYQDNNSDRDDIHENEEEEEEENWGSGYVLTHLASGYSLGHQLVDTPRQARLWLQLVASITDWRRPPHELARGQADLGELARQIEQARKEAIVGCSYLG